MICYTLENFYTRLKENTLKSLPEDTLTIISTLAAQVGAPEYIKTPQFNNKDMSVGQTVRGGSGRRRKKFQEINDEEWKTIRSFQTTTLKKKEGIEIHLYSIRKYLNMITLNTYDKLKENIIKEINIVVDTKTLNDLAYLCNELFNIISCNILYSDIYAKLYKDLIDNFSIFNEILIENFAKFEDKFTNIEYYDPEKDYDKFCENNKKNEKLRCICMFYVNLMKEDIIEKNTICKVIFSLFSTLTDMISSGNSKNQLDELSELISIMVINSYKLIKEDNSTVAKEIYANILKTTKITIEAQPGITNKCIFKHMDILDEISESN
jgi:hypothetical protein